MQINISPNINQEPSTSKNKNECSSYNNKNKKFQPWRTKIRTFNIQKQEQELSTFKNKNKNLQLSIFLNKQKNLEQPFSSIFKLEKWKINDLHHKLPISQNFNRIYAKIVKQYVCIKFVGLKMSKWQETYIYYVYITYVSNSPMMSWCEVCTIYILTKIVQLKWCNFA
jgi:hypothetical protein